MRRPIIGAIGIAVVQAAIVASLALQYQWDREHLPRAWALARPAAVQQPITGRYVRVPLLPETDGPITQPLRAFDNWVVLGPAPVTLAAREGRLVARQAPASRLSLGLPFDQRQFRSRRDAESVKDPPVLWPTVELYVPPAAGDPKRLLEGELWLEVSVPPLGAPRALRAGRMKDGKIVPFDF